MARTGAYRKLRWTLPLVALVSAAGVGLALPAAAATQVTVTFNYNGTDGTDGTAQAWNVPLGVNEVTVNVLGAQGGDDNLGLPFLDSSGGLGGSATAALGVSPGDVLLVNVGGRGTSNGDGGFNGGGLGGAGGGGGGGSDVSLDDSPQDRLLIAAGGGGGDGTERAFDSGGIETYTEDLAGGSGGGANGTAGEGSLFTGPEGGGGGTQTGGGAGGGVAGGLCFTADPGGPGLQSVGGSGLPGAGGYGGDFGAGGGGGYRGGGGGGSCLWATPGGTATGGAGGAGGGGSGFGPAGTTFQTGVKEGNGSVSITYTNTPPVAKAGADQNVKKNTAFTLNASGSTDANGDALRYHWAQVAGTPAAVIRDPDEGTPQAQVDGIAVNATLTFRVTVTDVHGDSSTDDVIIHVTSAPK